MSSLNLTYPGVYIQELENPVKTIVGVSTSVTAFVGRALKGPTNKQTLIHSIGDFERTFGGLWKKSTMSYAVYQYFLNGGKDAIIVRVFGADVTMGKTEDDYKARFEKPGSPLKFIAQNPGVWTNKFYIEINHDVDPDPARPDHGSLFNVKIFEKVGNVGVERESFLNVSYKDDSSRSIKRVLEEQSNYVLVDKSVGTLSAIPDEAKVNIILGELGYANDGKGDDGKDLQNSDLADPISETKKMGLYALADSDIFNLLCIPPPDASGTTINTFYTTVYTSADAYCKKRRAILLVDPPSDWTSADKPMDKTIGIEMIGLERSENAPVYFPRIKAPDPLEEGRQRSFPPCGVIAGIIATTDGQRGIWKAPAGIDTILTGVPDLELRLTDDQNGDLNPLGINCLRIMPAAGRVVWGARTMKGADRLTNQWKYLPVRRTALYIEESLYRGTQWVVFEPNDEPLWAQIRLNINAFMQDLFRKGAFQGSTPKEAYLVKCDKETTTQDDIDRGIVNIIVGFAPLKPAEFVIIMIQQLAGRAAEGG